MIRIFPLSILLISAMSSPMRAEDPLAVYTFLSADGSPTKTATGLDPQPASWHGIESRHGFEANTGSAFVQTSGLPQSNKATKMDETKYLEISLRAAPGKALNLSRLHFEFGGINPSPNIRSVRTFVRTSIDDFTSDLWIGEETLVSLPDNATEPVLQKFEVPLSGVGIKDRSMITFRFYPSVSGKGVLIKAHYSNIVFEGHVEPKE